MDGLNELLEVTLAENTIQKKMAMYKKDDGLSHQNSIKVLNFYCNQRSRFIFIHLMLQKSVKSFITEYIPCYNCCRWQHFLKIIKTITCEKNVRRRYYFWSSISTIKFQLTIKHRFCKDGNVFELFCIENGFFQIFCKMLQFI